MSCRNNYLHEKVNYTLLKKKVMIYRIYLATSHDEGESEVLFVWELF
jgi:hypothetical protein